LDTWRTAIVGCGPRALQHAEAYALVTAGRLVACCDLDHVRLHTFGDRFDIARDARYDDLGRLLEHVRPDVLHVVAVPRFRWSIVEVALRHPPRALIIDKPLAHRPDEGHRILDACAAGGVHVFVNHQLRFHTPWRLVRSLLAEGAVGPIRHVRASCRGHLLEQGTHLFDLLAFLFPAASAWEARPPAVAGAGAAAASAERPATWVLAQASDPDGFDKPHSGPGYACGELVLAPDWHVAFACGPDAPAWPGEDRFWLQFGIEVTGRDGRLGASLNHGWWLQTAARRDGGQFLYYAEDLLAQARFTEGVLRMLDDPSEHPNNAQRSQVSFDLVMAAHKSALVRRRVAPGERVTDRDFDSLRAALLTTSRG